MDWIQFGVQWLHVIFAIFWFGGAMFIDFVVMPTLQHLPPLVAREAGREIVSRIGRMLGIASLVVIVVGVLRGTAWGPLPPGDDSLAFASQYGITWSISLVFAIFAAGIGDGVLGRTSRKLYADDALWTPGTDGLPPAAFLALASRLRTWSIVQFVLFIGAFTCMILMRFGY